MSSSASGALRRIARLTAILALAGALQLAAAPAQAGGWYGGGGWYGNGGWHGGSWHGGGYGGGWYRGGWYGPAWYGSGCCSFGWWGPSISFNFATAPYYPYPYAYPAYAAQVPVYPVPGYAVERPVTILQPQQAAPGPAPQAAWYYCDNPRGFYPYVASCAGGWRAVPTTPPGMAP